MSVLLILQLSLKDGRWTLREVHDFQMYIYGVNNQLGGVELVTILDLLVCQSLFQTQVIQHKS